MMRDNKNVVRKEQDMNMIDPVMGPYHTHFRPGGSEGPLQRCSGSFHGPARLYREWVTLCSPNSRWTLPFNHCTPPILNRNRNL
eukprot:5840268-Amphidinium_carterae.1